MRSLNTVSFLAENCSNIFFIIVLNPIIDPTSSIHSSVNLVLLLKNSTKKTLAAENTA